MQFHETARLMAKEFRNVRQLVAELKVPSAALQRGIAELGWCGDSIRSVYDAIGRKCELLDHHSRQIQEVAL